MTGLEWLARFERSLRRLNVGCQLGTPEVRAHLETVGAEASMWPLGDGYELLFRDAEPSASTVLEELAHVLQAHRKRFEDVDVDLSELSVRREIEVKECLLTRSDLPAEEQQATREQLILYRDELARLERGWR